MATDWLKLQTEYLQSGESLRALARRHGVSARALGRVAADEGWAALRRARRLMNAGPPEGADASRSEPDKPAQGRDQATDGGTPAGRGADLPRKPRATRTDSPAAETPAAQAERRAKLMAISDRLTDQLARATVELDKQVLRHKRKTREVVYDGPEAKGKPVEETVEENYHLEIVDAPVNCAGLQKLSATLKNLREAARATDGDEQSVGRVAELMKKLDDEAAREDG